MSRLSSLENIRRSVRNLVARPPQELDPATAYKLWAATYDDSDQNALLHVETPIVQAFIRQANLQGKSVLDAGCGTGRHLNTILESNPRLVAGVDLSPAMLQVAQQKNRQIPASLYVARVEHLPFRDASFDFVLSTLVLAHVQNLNMAIAELSRVLTTGGMLLISCFHPFGKLASWDRSFQAEEPSGQKTWFSAQYFLHLHSEYFSALTTARMDVLRIQEPVIDENIRSFYERAGRLDIFERFKGYPLLLFFLARKK